MTEQTSTLEARIKKLERTQRRTRGLLILAGGVIAGMALAGFAQPGDEEERPKPVSLAYYVDGNQMYMMLEDGSLWRVPMSGITTSGAGQRRVPWEPAGR